MGTFLTTLFDVTLDDLTFTQLTRLFKGENLIQTWTKKTHFTHQAFAVAECHSGGAVLILQNSHIVTVVNHVVPPLEPVFAPVLHCEMFGHQVGAERQVQVKVLPVGGQ